MRVHTDEPLDEFSAGPGGEYVVVLRDGTVYGPFHNDVVAIYWLEDTGFSGRVAKISHPFKMRFEPDAL